MSEDDRQTARPAQALILELKNSSLWETLDTSWLRDAGETPDQLWERIRSHFEVRRAEPPERGEPRVPELPIRPGSR